ncbi:MAG: efflux RND transporter periplasmic adaptor subunit [Peptococcaceae bacterium]|nr:efflux RND transporter periplasmic adaptor subunit [Peptococcaceae bacterium]
MKVGRMIPALLALAFFFVQGCAGKDPGVRVVTERVSTGAPAGADYITGKIEALDSATIFPKVGGKVAEVLVDVGSRVKAGQALMRIDMPDVGAARDQLRAAVDEAEAAVKKARIDLETAEENYNRGLSLYNSGALSKADFDNKYAVPYELARIQAEETAPHKLAQARAALQSAEANYSNSVITSPIDGEVTARQINPGEVCSPGKPVFFVADLSRVVVVAYVDERKVNSLKVGQKVAVKVDPVDRMLEAEVRNISHTLDPAAKGYQVKFLVAGAGLPIKPGMFARVYTGGEPAKRFVVPKSALVEEMGVYRVFVYDGGKVTKVPVQVDKISDNYVVVGNGLSEGQELVVYSSSRLEDGMAVSVR